MNLRRICIVSGAFGVGKSEVAMNLALLRAKTESTTYLIDLDVVNPYFRSRESRHLLRRSGVEVISSMEGLEMADLPALSPAITGVIESRSPVVIDVGGDPAGATALGRFSRTLRDRPFDFLFVTNFHRPFCTSPEAAARLGREIEAVSRLELTGIVSNTHMMSRTGADDVARGIELSHETAGLLGIPVVMTAICEECFEQGIRVPDWWNGEVLLLKRFNDPEHILS